MEEEAKPSGIAGGSADRGSIRPYDRTGNIQLISSIQDILDLDDRFRKITNGLPIPIRVGSILRASELAYQNWGIQITDENRAELESMASEFYRQDAESGRSLCYEDDTLHKIKKGFSEPSHDRMGTHVGRLVKELATGSGDMPGRIRILDLACGNGRLSSSIATSLGELTGMLDRTEFHLVDYSDKLSKAENNLRAFGLDIVPHPMTDDKFLSQEAGKFDFVVSLSHFHRKPFLGSYLAKVRNVLSDNGALVSADWHSSLCHYPSQIYLLLQNMGLEYGRMNRFDELFGPLHLDRGIECLNEEEKRGIVDQYGYWRDICGKLGGFQYGGKMRLRIMSAFTTSRQLIEQLDSAGFTTSMDDIRRAFPRASLPNQLPIKLRQGSESTSVTVAIKRPATR